MEDKTTFVFDGLPLRIIKRMHHTMFYFPESHSLLESFAYLRL